MQHFFSFQFMQSPFFFLKKIKKVENLFLRTAILFFIFIGSHFLGFAQQNPRGILDEGLSGIDSSTSLIIRNISITGNKKTKDYIILREMLIHEGDTMNKMELINQLEKSSELIYNTSLFLEVKLLPIVEVDKVDIIILVEERWYIFPIPYFQLADRSFNEWVNTYHADFKRVSYGIFFTHFNFSGRKDRLALVLINGFKRNISFEYSLPYINKKLTTGLKFAAGFEETKEIPYKTDADNKLVYFKNDRFAKNEWFIKAAIYVRKHIKKTETFTLKFGQVNVADSIISMYNPDYFYSNSSKQNYVELEYWLQYNDVDNIMYPLTGRTFSLKLKKTGLQFSGGINEFSIKPNFNQYYSLSNQWYLSMRLGGEIKLPFDQPYYNQKALGYKEDYLRGYQYYVIDGPAYVYSKFDLKKKLLFFTAPTFLKSKAYQRIPFTIYAKAFADFGYSYHQSQTKLSNRFLYSGGIGFDVVMVHDFHLSIEFTLNQLGQKGLFLHP